MDLSSCIHNICISGLALCRSLFPWTFVLVSRGVGTLRTKMSGSGLAWEIWVFRNSTPISQISVTMIFFGWRVLCIFVNYYLRNSQYNAYEYYQWGIRANANFHPLPLLRMPVIRKGLRSRAKAKILVLFFFLLFFPFFLFFLPTCLQGTFNHKQPLKMTQAPENSLVLIKVVKKLVKRALFQLALLAGVGWIGSDLISFQGFLVEEKVDVD